MEHAKSSRNSLKFVPYSNRDLDFCYSSHSDLHKYLQVLFATQLQLEGRPSRYHLACSSLLLWLQHSGTSTLDLQQRSYLSRNTSFRTIDRAFDFVRHIKSHTLNVLPVIIGDRITNRNHNQNQFDLDAQKRTIFSKPVSTLSFGDQSHTSTIKKQLSQRLANQILPFNKKIG